MDSQSIELRLRLAAPEEPAVLPPLVLPAFDRFGRAVPNVRMRRPVASPRGNRLVYAVLALVLLMLSVIVAGALRIIDNPFDIKPFERSGLGCSDAYGSENQCFTITWPEGWHELAAGSFFPGDFTQASIAYERVALVVASVPLAACATPGGPFPSAYESGGISYQPRETADPALACIRTASLPPGAIRLSAEIGSRSLGVAAPDGPAIQDASEPLAGSGWTEIVGDRPARLSITSGTTPSGGSLETRTWDVILPDSIDFVLRIRAEIAGPDLAKGRADVQSVVDSIHFAVEPDPINPADAATAVKAAIDERDRGAQQVGFDFYACFPREPGSRAGTISAGPGERLPAPVAVTCRTSIEPSASGLWRVRLQVEWPAGDGYPAGGRMEELFVRDDGVIATSFTWLLDGSPVPFNGETALLPMAVPQLPPLLTGPLNLPIGSIAEMLYPGQYPGYEPDPANEALSPQLVGSHFHVVGGPQIVGGDEWYQVQAPDHFPSEVMWARGTFHGRPMLAVVEPACPTGPVAIDQLAVLPVYEQLACFGAAEVALSPVIAANLAPPDPALCMFDVPEPTTCPASVISPPWLAGDARQQLFGVGGSQGVSPGLHVWIDPSLGGLPSGVWLRVRGHFDDAAAKGCSWTSPDPQSLGLPPPAVQVLVCRERFVITGFEQVSAP